MMSGVETAEISTYCRDVAARAKAASEKMATLSGEIKNRWLLTAADRLLQSADEIGEANAKDLQAAPDFGLTAAQTDRLKLDDSRIAGIAQGLREVAALADPIGEVIESTRRPNGLQVSKVRVPLGVVFFIYESRPNVTADAAALCIKSSNAVILRGGKEAAHSSRAIVDIMNQVGREVGLPQDAVQLVSTTDRAAVGEFLRLDEFIDIAIPRGGEGLIRRVVDEAQMPVMKHFEGNCHVYVDKDADLEQAAAIVVNAKCQRMGVCNACESLLVHVDVADQFLPRIGDALAQQGVEVRGDARTCATLDSAQPASEEDWGREYLGPIISIAVVESLSAAVEHINRYGSRHTDAIVTTNLLAAQRFTQSVDSAAVMVNASTRFNDGNELGLGAEIGISTDKFHARGPCGLKELTTYKYVVYGDGQLK